MASRIIAIANRSLTTVYRCIGPDDRLTHTFTVKAIDFDNEKGANITVKVLWALQRATSPLPLLHLIRNQDNGD
jgi:hypothetical protein